MTLKKYNVILYFIILLNLVVVVIAQKSTLSPSPTISGASTSITPSRAISSLSSSSSTTSGEIPSSTLIPPPNNDIESCLRVGGSCKSTNDTLGLCGGVLKTPNIYIRDGIRSGNYKPESYYLSKCMCNQPYYDSLTRCIECFVNVTNADFKVVPIQEYKDLCKKLDTPFTLIMRPPSKAMPIKLKLMIALTVVLLGLLAIGTLQYCRTQRRKKRQDAFAQKFAATNLSGTDSDKYPPPSLHTHYPPPPSTTPHDYPPPPSNVNLPAPQPSAPYYPPPGGEYPLPQSQPPRGGQADSYYDGNF